MLSCPPWKPPHPILFLDNSNKLRDHLIPDFGVARLDECTQERFHIIWPPFRSCEEEFTEARSGIGRKRCVREGDEKRC